MPGYERDSLVVPASRWSHPCPVWCSPRSQQLPLPMLQWTCRWGTNQKAKTLQQHDKPLKTNKLQSLMPKSRNKAGLESFFEPRFFQNSAIQQIELQLLDLFDKQRTWTAGIHHSQLAAFDGCQSFGKSTQSRPPKMQPNEKLLLHNLLKMNHPTKKTIEVMQIEIWSRPR